MLIGYNDDTDILAGIPMSTVYPTVTQYPTSSAKSAMTVSFHMKMWKTANCTLTTCS